MKKYYPNKMTDNELLKALLEINNSNTTLPTAKEIHENNKDSFLVVIRKRYGSYLKFANNFNVKLKDRKYEWNENTVLDVIYELLSAGVFVDSNYLKSNGYGGMLSYINRISDSNLIEFRMKCYQKCVINNIQLSDKDLEFIYTVKVNKGLNIKKVFTPELGNAAREILQHLNYVHEDEKCKFDILYDNFKKVVGDNDELLFAKNFNKVSDMKVKSYCLTYKKTWLELLKIYNKFDNYSELMTLKYKKYVSESGKVSIDSFAKTYKEMSRDSILEFGFDNLKKLAGVKKLRYSDVDLKDNVGYVVSKLGRPPLYKEFNDMTEIAINTYAERLNLKGEVYDEVMKKYLSDDEYKEFVKITAENKSNIGKLTGPMSATYSIEDYEKNFKEVFENFKLIYGDIPSRRLFDKFTKVSDSSGYRRKYKKILVGNSKNEWI